MSKRSNGVLNSNSLSVVRSSRPDSIPGMEEVNSQPVSVTVRATSSASSPVSRSGSAKSRLDGDGPAMLSPDGAELVECASNEGTKKAEPVIESFECAICLQTCVHPVKLPCSHIFCFLCIKGVAIQSKRCALCRQNIPVEFCSDPTLLRKEDLLKEVSFEGGYQWYYQGMNGWWQYDERASADIEENFKKGEKTLEMLIAGFLYVVDFENMLQYRRNDPSRRRKIKRDLISIPDRKGVAGLKITSPGSCSPHRLSGDGGENVPCVLQTRTQPSTTDNSVATPSPSPLHNTPEESLHVGTRSSPDSDVQDVSAQIADLSLTPSLPRPASLPRQMRSSRPSRSSRTRPPPCQTPSSSDEN